MSIDSAIHQAYEEAISRRVKPTRIYLGATERYELFRGLLRGQCRYPDVTMTARAKYMNLDVYTVDASQHVFVA